MDATDRQSIELRRTDDGSWDVDHFAVVPFTCKSRPATEGDERYIYCEPSNEALDDDGERILQKALTAALPNFVRFGNLDLEHLSILGTKLGIRNPEYYQIGHPIAAVSTDPIVVKGVIYRGEGEHVEKANAFWRSITEQHPPRRWYPSIGGQTLERDGKTVTRVRWTNLAFAREPVNKSVPCVSLSPDGFAKAILAGVGTTDTAQLTGGAALRRESLHPVVARTLPGGNAEAQYAAAAASYLSHLGKTTGCAHCRAPVSLDTIQEHFAKCAGMDADASRRSARRLLGDVLARTTHGRREAA